MNSVDGDHVFLGLRSTVTNLAIITALTPLLTMVVSSILLREHPSLGMVFGSGIALWGDWLSNQRGARQLSY
jgi:drug/metabolite transporter (DMT)-like permease